MVASEARVEKDDVLGPASCGARDANWREEEEDAVRCEDDDALGFVGDAVCGSR